MALATTLGQVDELLAVVEGAPDGTTSIPGAGAVETRLMKVRYIGRLSSIVPGGTAVVGDNVFINDVGSISLTQGTIRRRVGSAMTAGTTIDVWFNGVGGADIDQTPIDKAYVVYGDKGALVNGFRVDGVANADAVLGGNSFTIKTGDNTTITQVLRRFSASGLAIQQWQTEGGTVLAQVLNSGQLQLAQGLDVTGGNLTVAVGNIVVSSATTLAWPGCVFSRISATQFNITQGTSEVIFASTLGSSLTLNNGGVTMAYILAGASAVTFGTATAGTSLLLAINGTEKWRIDAATGILVGQGARVAGVGDPISAQDAATATWATASFAPNLLINGRFDWWQRIGAAALDTGVVSGTGTTYGRGADRWLLMLSATGGATGFSGGMVRTTGPSPARYGARLSHGAGGYTDGAGYIALGQEVDRRIVESMRGKMLALSFKWQRHASMAQNVRIEITSNKPGGTESQMFFGYGNPTTLVTTTVANASIPTTWGVQTVNSAFSVPADAVGLHVGIFIDLTTAVVQYLDIADIMLVAGPSSGAIIPTEFHYAGGTLQGELELCQRYYEQSCPPDVATSTNTYYGAHETMALAISTGNISPWVLGSHPRFKVVKWRNPSSVKLWVGATANSWYIGGTLRASVADADGALVDKASTTGFLVMNNTGGAITPALDATRGQWAAEAEF